MSGRRPRCIGLALGSGAARGWAHIGVIRTLIEAGIVPQVVAGASIGAVVGAAYAADKLDAYEDWVRQLDRRKVIGYFDLSLRGGLIKAVRVYDFLRAQLPDQTLETLPHPFAAVATDLHSGDEVWLRQGLLFDALRASGAVPGMVKPVLLDGRWLIDGGLVNPVPISLCRALGADFIIAVDLNTVLLPRGLREQVTPPSILEVLGSSIDIMQVRITRSRIAGDPPEMLIAPQLPDFNMLDFDRADEAIAEGRRATKLALASLPAALLDI